MVDEEPVHYLWLRSLSYLEYIGYRKIVKSLGYEEMGKGTYHHLSDEIRHSYMLKELAENCFEKRYFHAFFDPSFIDIAETYFQAIDGAVNEWIVGRDGQERPYLCYMFVSYLIEKRAMVVYPEYFSCLQDREAKLIIQKIINDEKDHLSYLEDRLATLPETLDFKSSPVWEFEDRCFNKFLDDFQSCVTRAIH